MCRLMFCATEEFKQIYTKKSLLILTLIVKIGKYIDNRGLETRELDR